MVKSKEAEADPQLLAPGGAAPENPYVKNEGLNAAIQRVEEAKKALEEAKAELKAIQER